MRLNASEGPGDTALAEFHRKRMARFVRLVKEKIDSVMWQNLRSQHPDILTNVFMGRSIRWEELDTAEHPKIGGGNPSQALKVMEQQFITKLFAPSLVRPAPLARAPSLVRRASRYFNMV